MNFILRPPTAPERARLGGKAAALAALGEAGLPVPAWFAVTPDAFHASLGAAARRALESTTAYENTLRPHLAALAPAPEVLSAIANAVRAVAPGGTRFAVRSSAVDEDGGAHSFAGQLESFLDVPAAEVAARVADVWRSGFAPRVWAYRRERCLAPVPSAPAVLVQVMIAADSAGVAFSADPVSGRRGQEGRRRRSDRSVAGVFPFVVESLYLATLQPPRLDLALLGEVRRWARGQAGPRTERNPKFQIPDFRFRISDLRFEILDRAPQRFPTMTYERFEDVPVWQKAAELYELTEDLLENESFHATRGFRDQLDRAALPVSNNIAEGFERGTTNELLQFLYIARGSAGEVRSLLTLKVRSARKAGWPAGVNSQISNLISVAESCSRKLRGWAESLQNSQIKGATPSERPGARG